MAKSDISYKLLGRGALGGIMGAPFFLLVSALNDQLRLGYIPYSGGLQIMALPYFLLIGATLGALIGGIIWGLAVKIKANLPAIIRATIGACFILILYGVLRLTTGKESVGLTPPSFIESLIDILFLIISFGVLPGLMARTGNQREGKH
jgi:uncharacterized membrane protein YeaQ/YmgE (transglycosylase-associated protein family)